VTFETVSDEAGDRDGPLSGPRLGHAEDHFASDLDRDLGHPDLSPKHVETAPAQAGQLAAGSL
jgi:hypothetical protein